MKSLFSKSLYLLCSFICLAVTAAEPELRFKKVVDNLVDALNSQDYPRAERDFGEAVLRAFPLAKSKPFFQNMMAKYGKIEQLGKQQFTPPNQAVFPARCERGNLDIKIILDNQSKIVGLWFLPGTAGTEDTTPPSPPPPSVEAKNSTTLSLPFEGKWLTHWGGDTGDINMHNPVPNQKHAFDFIAARPDGSTYKNNGTKNQDYYAFGMNVLAPAAGEVTDVIRGVRDNAPGSMNPYSALGNAVFIRHREGEVSVLAHFKQGTITVKPGDQVKMGQLLGLCGNSGNSSQPHIHYHLQNTPIIQDGVGIKCAFDNIRVFRATATRDETRYSPVKGDVAENR